MRPHGLSFEHRPFEELELQELHDVLRLRSDIFVVEQRIWQENDIDGGDPVATHVLGRDDTGRLVASARIRLEPPPALVSRVVVRADARGEGVGTALMDHVHDVLGAGPATMSAQSHLEAWYRRLGWTREGPVYDDAGIPHVRMVWRAK